MQSIPCSIKALTAEQKTLAALDLMNLINAGDKLVEAYYQYQAEGMAQGGSACLRPSSTLATGFISTAGMMDLC